MNDTQTTLRWIFFSSAPHEQPEALKGYFKNRTVDCPLCGESTPARGLKAIEAWIQENSSSDKPIAVLFSEKYEMHCDHCDEGFLYKETNEYRSTMKDTDATLRIILRSLSPCILWVNGMALLTTVYVLYFAYWVLEREHALALAAMGACVVVTTITLFCQWYQVDRANRVRAAKSNAEV